MSVGGILGGAIGGVVGFFIGGTQGALYGAGIGFGIGSFLDPLSPDVPSPGNPAPDAAVMKSTIGDPCGDVCGTAKITGHLLAYGNEKSVPIYQEPQTSGGKGGPPEPEPQITGYDYYMSWQLGICEGPIDTLYAIYRGDDLLWEGPLNIPTSGGKETITISGFGSIDFYFGSDDQTANSGVADIIGDATLNSPLRHFCWAFMNNCKIGNYPRTPTLKFIVKKVPDVDYIVSTEIQDYDMVPSAVLYYILNSKCGLPTSWLNNSSFLTTDLALQAENRGISIYFKDSVPALTYLQGVLNHIDAVLRYGSDGQFHPKLIRDDYDVSTLPVVDEDDLLDDISFTRPSWIGTVNELKVQFTEIYGVDARSKQYSVNGLYGAGDNDFYAMSDAFAVGNSYYTFAKGDIDHIFDTKIWKLVGVVSGTHHGVAIDEDNLLWSWGENSNGQTGQNEGVSFQMEMAQAYGVETIKFFFCQATENVSVAITQSGVMYTCGWNRYNNLGLYPDATEEIINFTPVAAGGEAISWIGASFTDNFSQAISSNGFMYTVGGQVAAATGTGWDTDFTRDKTQFELMPFNNGGFTGNIIVSSSGYTFAEKGNKIWACGVNNYGTLGFGHTNKVERFTALSKTWKQGRWAIEKAGRLFVGITDDGELWGAGDNSKYALGLGDGVTNQTTMALLAEGTFEYCGVLSNAGAVALKDDGTIWAAGTFDVNDVGAGAGLTATLKEWTQIDTGGITFEYLVCGQEFTLAFTNIY